MGKITKIKWKSSNLEEWEKQRADVEGVGLDTHVRIGASDISVVMGSNKWKCPQRLFYHLCGYHSNFSMTPRTVAGHLIEPIIKTRWEAWETEEAQFLRNALAGFKNREIKKANFFLLNSDYKNMFVSVDYLPKGAQHSPFDGERYSTLTPHEMKHTTKDYYKLWTPVVDYRGNVVGRITQAYKEQVMAQMMCANAQRAVFLVLIDGVDFVPCEIERDDELCARISLETEIFAGKVEVGKMLLDMIKDEEAKGNLKSDEELAKLWTMFENVTPDPIGSDDNKNLINERFPRSNGLEMKGTDEDEIAMLRYLELNEQKKQAETEQLLIRNTLTNKAGDFEYIKAGTMKLTNRRGNDSKKPYFSISENKEPKKKKNES